MKVSFKFDILQYVKLKNLDWHSGRVVSLKLEPGDVILYNVEYWWESEIRNVWQYEDELGAA